MAEIFFIESIRSFFVVPYDTSGKILLAAKPIIAFTALVCFSRKISDTFVLSLLSLSLLLNIAVDFIKGVDLSCLFSLRLLKDEIFGVENTVLNDLIMIICVFTCLFVTLFAILALLTTIDLPFLSTLNICSIGIIIAIILNVIQDAFPHIKLLGVVSIVIQIVLLILLIISFTWRMIIKSRIEKSKEQGIMIDDEVQRVFTFIYAQLVGNFGTFDRNRRRVLIDELTDIHYEFEDFLYRKEEFAKYFPKIEISLRPLLMFKEYKYIDSRYNEMAEECKRLIQNASPKLIAIKKETQGIPRAV